MTPTSSPVERLSTPKALARLLPFTKPVMGRLAGGAFAALGAAIMTLLIPIVLQIAVDGPITTGDVPMIIWASLGILALGGASSGWPLFCSSSA